MKYVAGKFIFGLLVLSYFIGAAQDYTTRPEANRDPVQKYYEDSVHVFWTQYPNPFSPPTVGDTGRWYFHSPVSFYCDLSDTVEIELLNEKDSVVYHAPVISRKPFFQLGYWIAGPKVNEQTLPEKYFKRRTAEYLSWMIVVNGRRKCRIETGNLLGVGWYLWMKN